jgi:hypothetical protein
VKVSRLLRLLSAASLILLIVLFPPFPASADQISWTKIYEENFEDGSADCWSLDTGWGVELDGTVQLPGCLTWSDVISKYNTYVSSQATWTDVINCYTAYVTP